MLTGFPSNSGAFLSHEHEALAKMTDANKNAQKTTDPTFFMILLTYLIQKVTALNTYYGSTGSKTREQR